MNVVLRSEVPSKKRCRKEFTSFDIWDQLDHTIKVSLDRINQAYAFLQNPSKKIQKDNKKDLSRCKNKQENFLESMEKAVA